MLRFTDVVTSQRVLRDAQQGEFSLPSLPAHQDACGRKALCCQQGGSKPYRNIQAVVPALAEVERRERAGLEDAMRKGLLGLQRKRLEDFRPKNTCQVWLWQRVIIFPFSAAADVSALHLYQQQQQQRRPWSQLGETKLHAYCKCSFDKPVWLYTHILFSRRRWISWWNATKSVGSRTAGFSSQKIPVCCGRLCTGLWEFCWRWYSSAFWQRYILCPHQVNNQACTLQQRKQKKRGGNLQVALTWEKK